MAPPDDQLNEPALPAWRRDLASRLERDLHRHAAEPWFPRARDEQAGGFHVRFDRRWRLAPGPEIRSLESQARQTRSVARLGLAYPANSLWPDLTRHGIAYLRGAMYDPEYGGWFSAIDREGRPLAGGSKHGHGVAYTIGAGVEAYRLTGDADALALAREALAWLERTVHDPVHGGYMGWTDRRGKVVVSDADVTPEMGREPLGNQIVLKDANTNSDVLEALCMLAAVSPDDQLVRERLAEAHHVCLHRMADASGRVAYLSTPDWTPVPHPERTGYGFQVGYRLIASAEQLGGDVPEAVASAGRMTDRIIERGWDTARGGFVFELVDDDADDLTRKRAARREWWVLTEAIRALALLVDRQPERKDHRARLEGVLDVAEREFIDHRYGGWYAAARRDRPLYKRLLRPRDHKGDEWKDAAHEVDMYLDACRALRGVAAYAPLEPIRG